MHQQKRPVATKIIYCRIEVINNSVKVRSGVSSTPVGYYCSPASSLRTPARDELRHSRHRRHLSCLSSPSSSPPVTTHWPHRPPQCQLGSLDTVNHSRSASPLSVYVTTLAVRHHRCRASPAIIAIFSPSFSTRKELLRLRWISCGVVTFTYVFYLSLSMFLSSAFSPLPLPPSLYPSRRFIFSKLKFPVWKKRLSLWLLFPSLTFSEL